MINEEVYDRILNSLDDNEKTSIKEMNRNCYVKENELDQGNTLEKQKAHTSQSNSDTKKARENGDTLRNDLTTEILDKLESIENQLGDSLQNQKYSQGIQNDIQDSYIENFNKRLNGRKRKNSDEHDKTKSKTRKLNKGTKRKISDEHDEIESKINKLRGTKRKFSDEHDEIESKIRKLNRGTKRNNHFHSGNQQKKRKLCFNIWE